VQALLLCLLTVAALLVACAPPPRLPITGEIKLAFVRKATPDIHFKLQNQTSGRVSFWGARDWWWEDIFPQGPQFECVLADRDETYVTPYPLIDGPAWEKFALASGEEVEIVVSDFYLGDSDGRLPAGRCKFVLQLDDGAVVKSEEFQSMSSASRP